VLFRQGDVQEHTELSWLLSAVVPLGGLNRMHQFRDKSAAQRELVSAGLLFYPVLMAADVLAYRAHEVPVGEDQREHLELMRDAARRFNSRFGDDILVVPDILANAGGVTVSYFEWVQDIQAYYWDEDEVNDRLRKIMEKSYVDVLALSQDRKLPMRTAATMLGVGRVAEAHVTRGLYP